LFPALDPIAARTGIVSSTGVVHGFFSVLPEEDFTRSIGTIMQLSPSSEHTEGEKSNQMQRDTLLYMFMLFKSPGQVNGILRSRRPPDRY
jgi:hypothetical protein